MVISKQNYIDIVSYLSTIWLIIISGVVTIGQGTNNFVFVVLGTVFMSIVLLGIRKKATSYIRSHYLLFLMLGVVSVQMLLEMIFQYVYYGSIKLIVIFCFCYLLTTRIEIKKAAHIFSNIILFLAVISLVLYWFNSTIIKLPNISTFSSGAYERYSNLYLYCVLHSIPHRNCGVFWEPGAYAVFLNIALAFTLFVDDKSTHFKFRVLVYIFTIITTISTHGYICMALLLFAYFSFGFSKQKFFVILLLLTIGFVIIDYFLPIINTSFSYKFGLGGYELSNNVTSRINPFLLDLHIIRDHPFGLVGVDAYYDTIVNYSHTYGLPFVSSSCTPTMTIAVFGLIPGLILFVRIFKFGRVLSTNFRQSLLLGILMVILFTSESFIIYGLYYYMAFLSYVNKRLSFNHQPIITE